MLTFKEFSQLTEEYQPQRGTQYGSNPGGIHLHQPSMRKMYVKFPYNPEQAHVEAATSDLYKEMGIKTLDPVVKHIDGKTAVVTPWNEHVAPMRSAENLHNAMRDPNRVNELANMHHAAVITGNLDIVGMEYDNILQHKHTGDLISADQGGAMHFRAMGDQKDFGPSISKEIGGFQNPAYQSGKVFSRIPHAAMQSAAKNLDTLSDEKIDAIMNKHGLGHLAHVIKTRRDLLKQHYAQE